MPKEFSFADIVSPDKKQDKEEEFSFADIVSFQEKQPKKEEFSFSDITSEQPERPQPQGLYGQGTFYGYEPPSVSPFQKEPTREVVPPIPYAQAYPAGLIEAGRQASKNLLPPLNWYIEKGLKEMPAGYNKKLMDHPIAKKIGKGFGEAGSFSALMLGGQALGLFNIGPQFSAAFIQSGMNPLAAGFLGGAPAGGLLYSTMKGLSNLSDVMLGKKEPDIKTLLWEPAGAGTFGAGLWGGQVMGGAGMAALTGGVAHGVRTAAPYIEKMWRGEKPEWKALATDMAISVPIGMIVNTYAHNQTANGFMNATKEYMVQQNADFIQANADLINKNPESFMFATKYKGQPIEWKFQPEVQDIIKSGQADLSNRKTALSLSRKIVDHFFSHPSPQVYGDFGNLSKMIKNYPELIESVTQDIKAGTSPTVALMNRSAQKLIDTPEDFVDESQIAKQFTDKLLAQENNAKNVDWSKITKPYDKDIKPEYQQLIESSKALWESNNLLIEKYEKAKMIGGLSKEIDPEKRKADIAARRQEFADRIEELKTDNEKIKARLKDYGFTPASAKQKSLAHKLVNRKGMDDATFLNLKQELTGTDSMTTMSRKQANVIINALGFSPKDKKILVKEPPVFKKPTLFQWPTSKYTYAKALGLGPVMEDLFIAEANRSIEMDQITKFADNVSKSLKKQASLGDRLASKIKAQPTKPEEWMSELMMTYEKPEDLPKDITPENKQLFGNVRKFTLDMLSRENAVREIMGQPPIENIKAYLPRVLTQIAKAVLNEAGTLSIETDPLMRIKDLDVPDDAKDWLKVKLPNKPFNPTEFARKNTEDLKEFFSKDIGKLIKWLGHYATREIYLSEPLEIFKGQLEHYADLGVLQEETKNWALAVVKYDILKQPSDFEKSINNTFQPLTDVINKVLHPINRHLSDPISQISKASRKLVIAGALVFRPKMPIRNTMQRGLLLNMYPAKHFIKAQLGLHNMPKEVKQQLRDTWIYRISKRFEDAPDIKNKLLTWGMKPYGYSHAGIWPGKVPLSNVDVAMATGWLSAEELRTSPRYIKWAEKLAQRRGKPKDFYKRTPSDSIEEAIRAVEKTQFIYHTAFMQQYFRGQIGRFFGSLTSWGNFFTFTHNRELLNVLARGESDTGKPYPPYYRSRSILGYATLYAILEGMRQTTGLDYSRFYFGVPVTVLNPMARFTLGSIMYTTAKSPYDRNYGKYLMESSVKMFTGGGLGASEWKKWMTGEISTKEFLFYPEIKKGSLSKMF